MHGGPRAVGGDLDVAMFVALEHTVAALVALLAEPPRYSLRANLAHCATTKMLGDKSMFIVDVKLDALPPPSGPLGNGQRHQVVLLDTSFYGLQDQGRSLMDEGSG